MNKTVFLFLISIFMFYCSGENPGEIEAPGIVDGDVITMKSLVPGQIRKISIQEGDQVEKNALVIAIDSDKTENKLESLNMALEEIDINETKLKTRLEYIRSSIDYLEKQVQRFTRLKEKKSIPGEKLESMELKLKEARTSETDIRKSLETLTVEGQEPERIPGTRAAGLPDKIPGQGRHHREVRIRRRNRFSGFCVV